MNDQNPPRPTNANISALGHQSIEPSVLQRIVQRRRDPGRALSRGVTLVEVLIVVAIMALIAGGVGFAILPKYKKAQVDSARTNARKIRAVATQYLALNGGECPSVESLIADRELDADGGADDPWGQPFTITCSGDDIAVSSPGPDTQDGTEDDIRVGGGGE